MTMTMTAQELRSKIAFCEEQIALMKRELLQHQSFKIVSSAYGHIINDGPLDYQKALRIELQYKQQAQELEDKREEKAYRKCVTAVPYKWLDTDELVFPDAWETCGFDLGKDCFIYDFDFSKSTIKPTFMEYRS